MKYLTLSRRTVSWLLSALLLAEILLLLGKYDHFFNGDSLFFFSNRVTTLEEIWTKIQAPDHLWQYRPLTFVIFSFLLYPLFGTRTIGYNVLPVLVHLAATILVYRILRRLGLERLAAFLGAFFFGTHSVAFYVTYGVAFLPDFSYAIFFLASVYFFLKHCDSGSAGLPAASIAFASLALLCKEAAITLPAVALYIGWLHPRTGGMIRGTGAKAGWLLGIRRAAPLVVLGLLYLALLWTAKGGQLYAPAGDHPHHARASLEVLLSKYKYLKWAFNLPDGLVFEFESWTNYGVAAAVFLFAAPFAVTSVIKLGRRDPVYWIGTLWFATALAPVVFLSNLTMNHNLYIPLVGLSLMMGAWMAESGAWILDRSRPAAAAFFVLFAASTIAAAAFHNSRAARDSWIAEASIFARQSLQEFKTLRPTLGDKAALCILNGSTRNLAWFYDYGSLFRLFYPSSGLDVKFYTFTGELPADLEPGRDWIVLLYDGRRLIDVTEGMPGSR